MQQTSSRAFTVGLFKAPALHEERRTYVIVGNGRGGTSMIAGMAASLGLPLGASPTCVVFEDQEIVSTAQRHLLAGPDMAVHRDQSVEDVRELLMLRAASNPVWGWKDPSADLYLQDVIGYLDNPHIIMVWRDVSAVASSHIVRNPGLTPIEAFEIALARYNRYWVLLKELEAPVLSISYEQAARAPLDTLEAIGAFTGLPVTASARAQVGEFVTPGSYRLLPKVA